MTGTHALCKNPCLLVYLVPWTFVSIFHLSIKDFLVHIWSNGICLTTEPFLIFRSYSLFEDDACLLQLPASCLNVLSAILSCILEFHSASRFLKSSWHFCLFIVSKTEIATRGLHEVCMGLRQGKANWKEPRQEISCGGLKETSP